MIKMILIIGILTCAVAQDITQKKMHQVGLLLPIGYNLSPPAVKKFSAGSYSVQLYAQKFAQGNAVYVEIIPAADTFTPAQGMTLQYNNSAVCLSARPWGYRGLFAIAPDETAVEKSLTVTFSVGEKPLQYIFPFTIAKSNYSVFHSRLKVGKFSDINHAQDSSVVNFIAECSRKKKEAFNRNGPDRLSFALAYPRNVHKITSPFWSTRVYEKYEIKNGKRIELPSSSKFHRGIDLRGPRGEPIFALADGEVILAEKMYYEGNFTVIDHGNRVMSYYMHQDSILVHVGQIVHAGDTIGKVGNTGQSTGAHLHLSLVIDGIQVDPLSILPLPIRRESDLLQAKQ
jgi:murein DD-endopeptidase